uniref:Uncharacterized protein LOC101506227 n=1 Tax=Cicer arietinum TaxID=3827 RepID=A0A1S3ECD2_CICAR|nr:uncharacterized protein LOC101506227 [Cicer arietinum]
MISDIVYQHLVFFGENTKRFELMKICDNEDVELMFDVYAQWSQLGTIELYVTFESGPPSTNIDQPSTSNIPYQPNLYSPSQHYEPSQQCEPSQHYPPSQHYEPYSTQLEQTHPESFQLHHQSPPTSPQCDLPLSVLHSINEEDLSDYSEEDETYFDESSDNSVDDIDGDKYMKAEDQPILLDFDPPSHLKSINLDTQQNSSEFDHLFINEVPTVDGTLAVGMKFHNKDECVHAIKHAEFQNAKKSELWVINKLNVPHTCTNSALPQDHMKLDSNKICQSIMQVVKVDPSIKVKVIVAQIRVLHNYTVSYKKVWMGKNKAIEQIYGNWEESCNQLPQWLQSTPTMVVGYENTILGFVPCISTFKFCKPIVQVDGSWLYRKYKGTLLVAVAQDGNENVIPIAYAIVEG